MELTVQILAITLIVYLLRWGIIGFFFGVIILIGIVIRYTCEGISKLFDVANLWLDS